MIDAAQTPQRFVFVDALRGISALWVVVFHAFASNRLDSLEVVLPGWSRWLIHMGYVGVTVFFVLSGFVIAHSFDRQRVDAPSIGWFMIRRSVRLDPPYWLSIAATLVVARAALPSCTVLVAHMFYLQDLLRMEPLSPIYWTLCLEFQFYLMFALLLGIAYRFRSNRTDHRSLRVTFTAAALVAAVFPVGLADPATLPAGLFLPRWYTFLVGAFACWAINGTIPRFAFYAYVAVLFAAAIELRHVDAVVATVIAALLLVVGRAGALGNWLHWQPLQLLGRTSYGLYLLHNPIIAVTFGVLRRITPSTPSWELLWLLIVLVSSCVGAWLFWKLVERPCMIFSRRCRPSAQLVLAIS